MEVLAIDLCNQMLVAYVISCRVNTTSEEVCTFFYTFQGNFYPVRPLVSVVVLWGGTGTTFPLLLAVASRDENKLLPPVPSDSLLGSCHC